MSTPSAFKAVIPRLIAISFKPVFSLIASAPVKPLSLYKKYSAETPTAENFDFWLFADCFSAIYTEKGTAFIHRVQPDSLAYYIAKVYGENYVWQLNMDTQIVIDGKPYSDIVDEWYNYIKSLNN